MKAIAAMSRNRVIGRDGAIPWHLPEDFRWFKRATLGHAVLMGRKTFQSIGQPLPGRLNLVVSRALDLEAPGMEIIRDLRQFRPADYEPREVWIAGGAEIYRQLLGRCSELYLTLVNREVEGDTFFPPFEEDFEFVEVTLQTLDFEVRRYRRP